MVGVEVGVNPMRLNNELIGRALKGEAAPGKYRDGRNGLVLCVGKSGSASWIMRFMHQSRRRDHGIGPLRHIGLAQARRIAAAKMGALKGEGIDPLEGRAVARQQQRLSSMTFGKAAAAYIEANRSAWKDKRAADTWVNSLRDHADALTNKRVGEITTADVYAVLDPIWATLNPTAVRVRGRIEKILSFAKVNGHRSGENPARWRDNLEAMLPKPKAVKRTVKHHARGAVRDDAEGLRQACRVGRPARRDGEVHTVDSEPGERGQGRAVGRDQLRPKDVDGAGRTNEARPYARRAAQRRSARSAAQPAARRRPDFPQVLCQRLPGDAAQGDGRRDSDVARLRSQLVR